MVVELDQPGAERAGAPARRPGQVRPHARRTRPPPGPALGEHTDEVLDAAGYSAEEIAELIESGAAAGRRGRRPGLVHGMSSGHADDRERQADCCGWASSRRPRGSRRRRSSTTCARACSRSRSRPRRNMAYYPPEFVERIRLIKQLQEERYMPLKVIKELLEEDPERAKALVELGDRILERARAGEQRADHRRRGPRPLRRTEGGARPSRGARRPHTRRARLLARPTSASSTRSAASAPAATTSGSASPSTTPSATSARSSELVKRRGRGADGAPRGRDGPRPRARADRGRRGAASGPDRGAPRQAPGRGARAPPRLDGSERPTRRSFDGRRWRWR